MVLEPLTRLDIEAFYFVTSLKTKPEVFCTFAPEPFEVQCYKAKSGKRTEHALGMYLYIYIYMSSVGVNLGTGPASHSLQHPFRCIKNSLRDALHSRVDDVNISKAKNDWGESPPKAAKMGFLSKRFSGEKQILKKKITPRHTEFLLTC